MEKKPGFFKRMKKAITNFESYQKFATETTGQALKYFFIIVLLLSLIISLTLVYKISLTVNESISYIETELPDFVFKDNQLTLQSDEAVILERDELGTILIMDTTEQTEEQTNQYRNKMNGYSNGALFLKEKVMIKMPNMTGTTTYDYKTLVENYKIGDFTKQDLISYVRDGKVLGIYASVYIIMLIYIFITYILVTALDVLILSALGFITTKLYKTPIPYRGIFNMSIYALTLPILLNILYIIINTFTGFTIQYFQVMYNVVSYIYIIAAILMMKADLTKQKAEVEKIEKTEAEKEEEEAVQENKPKENEKEKEDEKKDKKDTGGEPEGSKA